MSHTGQSGWFSKGDHIWFGLRRGTAAAEAEAEQSQGGQESPQKKFGLEPIPDGPQRRDSFVEE